jgi:hypothetical protein
MGYQPMAGMGRLRGYGGNGWKEAEPEGHHNNGERRFRVEQRTPAGGPLDDAFAPIPVVRLATIGRLKLTRGVALEKI